MTARTLTDADVEAIADAVADAVDRRLRARAPAARRVKAAGRARLPAAEAAKRAAAISGEVDEVTRERVRRAMGRSGVR